MGISITGGVKVPQGKFSVGPAAVGFTANAVNFDGSNDVLDRGAGLTGAVDNDTLLISFWIDILGSDGVTLKLYDATSGRFVVRRLSNNKLRCGFKTSADADVWAFTVTNDFVASGGWRHVLIAIDDAAGKRLIYIDDAVPSIDTVTSNSGDIDWTVADWSFGGLTLDADVAEVYATNEFLDVSIEANRRKFIDAAGKPVDLGSDGSTPTGTASLIFFSGETDSWHTNKGSGGGFTETGALTDAASTPSD